MVDKWRLVTTAQIAKRTATGPFGSSISSKYFSTCGVPVIRGSNLSQSIGVRLADQDIVYLDEGKADEFSRSEVRRGDLVFTCWGTIDQVGLIDKNSRYDRYIVSNKQMLLTPDEAIADCLFLYYQFSSPKTRAEILNRGIGSSVPGFNLGQLREMEFLLPPLKEQRAIAHILGTLDDKIELNRRRNQTLEAMARALFQDWFVDFGPVHAKMEGREPYLPADLWQLFPDRLSGVGKPDGWEINRVSDFLTLAYGKSLPAGKRNHGTIPVYGSGGVTGFHDEALISGPAVIVGRKGTVGSLYWEDRPCFPIDTVFYVQPEAPVSFCYYLLESLPLRNMNTDAAVPGLNRENVYRLEVAAPPAELIAAFAKTTARFRERIAAISRESQTFADLRDTLLPRLISGELRVPDIERHEELTS